MLEDDVPTSALDRADRIGVRTGLRTNDGAIDDYFGQPWRAEAAGVRDLSWRDAGPDQHQGREQRNLEPCQCVSRHDGAIVSLAGSASEPRAKHSSLSCFRTFGARLWG